MDYNDWLKEYYPVEAKNVSQEDALKHGLKKWQGLRPDVLKQHHLEARAYYLHRKNGVSVFGIDATTCALCVHHMSDDHGDCQPTCPLMIVRGNVPCDQANDDETLAPFGHFIRHADPEPMIALLELAIAKLGNAS